MFTCPFCKIIEKDEPCCENKELKNNEGIYVCVKCGRVNGFEMVNVNENKHKIRRKSKYYRKYHIENILNSLCQKIIEISYNKRQKKYDIFNIID